MAQRKGDMMIGRPLQEDGHTDVSSAVRQCKTITEDAMQIMGKLQSMSGEDSLPTWWTNKLAVASNIMNKIRDYLLVPSIQEEAGDIPDLKKLVGELQNASNMHLAQSKRVQAHVDMMTKAGDTGPKGKGGIDDLKTIVGELQKASEAHKRQSKSIDAHVKFMGEETEIDEGKMSDILITIDDIANAMKKDRNMKPFIDRFKKDARKTLDPKIIRESIT